MLERMAKSLPAGLPPIPVVGYGRVLASMIPGRGVVFPQDEVGAIATWDGVLAARIAGDYQDVWGAKYPTASINYATLWQNYAQASGIPVGVAYTNVPGGAVLNAASAGALPLTATTGANKKYLTGFTVGQHGQLSLPGITMLVDLLVAAGNISANTTAATTVNTTALTRYTDGVGVMIGIDVTTILGNTGSTLSLNYTGTGGSGHTATIAMPQAAKVGTMAYAGYNGKCSLPIVQLASGDTGALSVQTATLSSAMGAGVFAVVLYKILAICVDKPISTTLIDPSSASRLSQAVELPVGTDDECGFLTLLQIGTQNSYRPIIGTFKVDTCEG